MRHYVGMKIAAERQRQGLSQEDFATLIGVRQTTISRIEGGKWAVSIDMIEQLLKALNCTLKIEKEL